MTDPKLIILYGRHGDQHNAKQQRMIDGLCTCGYREYARKFGIIIYLQSQRVAVPWEARYTDKGYLMRYLLHPDNRDAIVWSVKHDPRKDEVLREIPQKSLYYSCNAHNCVNPAATVSLVDTEERVSGNARLWFKGKDPDFWKPQGEKAYDYLLMGRRADKNELYFLKALHESSAPHRRVLWIGGAEHEGKVPCRHDVTYMPFCGPESVAELIPQAKVGILFTEHPSEGFPQSMLEMMMCGLPVVYNMDAPWNTRYRPGIVWWADRKRLLRKAEEALWLWSPGEAARVASVARMHFSLAASWAHMKGLLCTP